MPNRHALPQGLLVAILVTSGLCASTASHAFFFENLTIINDTPTNHVATLEYSVSAVGGTSNFIMNGSPNWFWRADRSDWDNDGALDDVKVEAFHLVGPHVPEGPNVLHAIVYLFNTGAGGGAGGPSIHIVQHSQHRDKLDVSYASIGADRSLFTITLDHESLPAVPGATAPMLGALGVLLIGAGGYFVYRRRRQLA